MKNLRKIQFLHFLRSFLLFLFLFLQLLFLQLLFSFCIKRLRKRDKQDKYYEKDSEPEFLFVVHFSSFSFQREAPSALIPSRTPSAEFEVCGSQSQSRLAPLEPASHP